MSDSMLRFGLDVRISDSPMGFGYGNDVIGPLPEIRTLEQIRRSLRDPDCQGPEQVYAIAMDVAKQQHLAELKKRMLLFGIVTYAQGQLGQEPIRSQGHVHRISTHSGWSPPELYEIWQGKAIIYMQERVEYEPGRCFAVHAGPGEKVLVPPGWAHATISADPHQPLTFAARANSPNIAFTGDNPRLAIRYQVISTTISGIRLGKMPSSICCR